MTLVSAYRVRIRTRRSAEAFKTIMGASQEVSAGALCLVARPIGGEGWSAVAEGIKSHPGVIETFVAPLLVMEEASREDLKKIWDALSQDGTWRVPDSMEFLRKQTGEAAWRKMESLLDLEQDALDAYVRGKIAADEGKDALDAYDQWKSAGGSLLDSDSD